MKANWTRCSARTSTLAPTSTSVTGCAGDRDRDRERRAVDARGALDVEEAGGERGAGRAAADERVGVARGDGARGADDRGVGGRADGARRGRAPWRSRPGRRRPRRPSATSPNSLGGPEEQRRAPPAAAATAAPAATSAGPRSAPLASTATVMGMPWRLPSGRWSSARGRDRGRARARPRARRRSRTSGRRGAAGAGCGTRARVVRRRRDLVLGAALGRAARATASAWGRPWATAKGRASAARACCALRADARRRHPPDARRGRGRRRPRLRSSVALHDVRGRGRGRARRAPARAHPPSAGAPIPAAAGWPSTTAASPASALALIREGVWGFSLFGVAEALQGRGVGRELFARCWAYGAGARGQHRPQLDQPAGDGPATRTPGCRSARAWRRPGSPTSRARPTSTASSTRARRASRWPTPSAATLRGAGHGRDLPRADGPRRAAAGLRGPRLRPRAREQHHPARRPRRGRPPSACCGRCFVTAPPGATVNVDFLTAGQDWALPVCLDARLPLSPDGPMFAGGTLGPLAPYIPSGAYL